MIKKILKKYKIDHLHYMTPIQNVPSILTHGILSKNKVNELQLPHSSVAAWFIQKRREFIIPVIGKKVHDFVPLYFATHTPMQSVLTRGNRYTSPSIEQKNLIFIEVDAVKMFRLKGVIFTDGNAASQQTCFYTDLTDLSKLSWDLIYVIRDCSWGDDKRMKAAEVLVPDKVPLKLFKRVIAYDNKSKNDLIRKAKSFERKNDAVTHLLDIQICVDPTHYYPEKVKTTNDSIF